MMCRDPDGEHLLSTWSAHGGVHVILNNGSSGTGSKPVPLDRGVGTKLDDRLMDKSISRSSSISGILRGKPSKPILCIGQNTRLVPQISSITVVVHGSRK